MGGAVVNRRSPGPVLWGHQGLWGAEEVMEHFRGQMAFVELAEEHPTSGGVGEGRESSLRLAQIRTGYMLVGKGAAP